MKLIHAQPFYFLEESIHGEIPTDNKSIEYSITYLDNKGERDEFMVNSFQMMINFIKWIYEQEDFQDVVEDPRSPEFFQNYMNGDLIAQN